MHICTFFVCSVYVWVSLKSSISYYGQPSSQPAIYYEANANTHTVVHFNTCRMEKELEGENTRAKLYWISIETNRKLQSVCKSI